MNSRSSNLRTVSPIQAYLEQVHARFASLDAGAVATYIPELAKADPRAFGIVVATVDGRVYEVGDSRKAFSMQSITKPLVYGMALEDSGAARVEQTIGVEPSGDAFNSISLEPGSGRPLNPMINAGAIATASLIAGASVQARLQRMLAALSVYAGRALQVDEAVFESERTTGHRNRAIGHMLRNYDVLQEDPEAALELYFKQCSVLADCRDLALIAATLANRGVNPVTGERAVDARYIGSILSLMTTCGMYDFSGEWVYRVGLPAKSGVGGGIIAVLPGQLGIGVYSPPLDSRGNSVRGVKVCEALSAELGLHFLQPPRPSISTVRAHYTLAEMRSKRRRPPAESAVLDRHGRRVAVFELQGDLRFSTIEPVLRAVVDADEGIDYAVLDFKRVTQVDAAATRMLARLVNCCAARGQHLVLTRVRRRDLLATFGDELYPHCARSVSFQPQLELGLEWCERGLLQRHAAGPAASAINGLAEHRLCEGAEPADIAWLAAHLGQCHYATGSQIVRRGDLADTLFFLMRGEVSVVVALPGGGHKRLATLSAGMGFGESALIGSTLRSADVRADSEVECCTLGIEAFVRLQRERPALALVLMRNLLRSSVETAARLTAEVATLEG
jgi:glutaminase